MEDVQELSVDELSSSTEKLQNHLVYQYQELLLL